MCGVAKNGTTGPRERSDREAQLGHAEVAQAKACGSLRKGWFAAATVLFVAALFARENAVVFPLLTMACDLACGGRKHFRARRPGHLALLLCAAAFAVWRVTLFENHIPTAYLRLPDDWSYVPWLLAKLLHYLACVVWQAPLLIGPMAYDNPYAESTADAVLTAAVVALFAGAYCFACRRCVRGWWFWPVWILLSVLPVVPFLATPHMAYMAGVGFVIAVVLKPASAQRGSARISTAVAVGMLLLSVMAFSVYGLCWRGVLAAERATIAQVTANPRPPAEADIFVINLPLANVYLPLDLERVWNVDPADGRVHVLTYAPHPLVAPSLTREAGLDPRVPTRSRRPTRC